MKSLTYQETIDEAKVLIDTNGHTTSLEVKTALRTKGFWAKQKDVSDFLKQWSSQEVDVQASFNGRNQIYSLVNALSSSSSSPAGRRKVILPFKDHTGSSNEDLQDMLNKEFTEDAWIVSHDMSSKQIAEGEDYSSSDKVCSYPSSATRDQVRTHFATEFGLPIQEVYACRIKSFLAII
jgi:hypothetical protein